MAQNGLTLYRYGAKFCVGPADGRFLLVGVALVVVLLVLVLVLAVSTGLSNRFGALNPHINLAPLLDKKPSLNTE